MATTRRDYYEILGVSRDADDKAISPRFAGWPASSIPTSTTTRRPRSAFGRRRRPMRSSRSARPASSTTASATKGSARADSIRPTSATWRQLPSSSGTVFGGFGGRPGARAARGADILAEVEIELAEAATKTTHTVPFRVAVTCRTCEGSGAAPGTSPIACPRCHGAGRLQSVSSSVFGQFVRTQTCPQCGGLGEVVESPCPDWTRGSRDGDTRARGRDPGRDP